MEKRYSRYKPMQNFNRNLLPTPKEYYSKEFINLNINSHWVKARCPFHNDHAPSLSVNLIYGGFKCWSCSACGKDVLDFQMKRYNQDFRKAVTALNAWEAK